MAVLVFYGVINRIAEKDLTVEHLQWDDAHPKEWCVVRQGQILARHSQLDTALVAARVVMHVERCSGWLVRSESAAPYEISATLEEADQKTRQTQTS